MAQRIVCRSLKLELPGYGGQKQGERQVTKYYLEMTSLRQELDLCVEEKRGMPNDNLQCKKRLENERVLIPLDDKVDTSLPEWECDESRRKMM